MPRAGLNATAVAVAGAALADEIGWSQLTMARLAERVGVRTPSLYKHVASQEDLQRRIAVLALTEAADCVGAAVQGRSGREALAAAARALRDFVVSHPGRYAATLGLRTVGDDAVAVAAARGLEPFAAVLRAYDVPDDQLIHALRTMRSAFLGFAALQADGGFQYATDVDDSFEYLIDVVDAGLRALAVR